MKEHQAWHANGFLATLAAIAALAAAIWCFVSGNAEDGSTGMNVLGVVLLLLALVAFSSLTVVQPNQAKIITFFGRYKGTVSDSGLWIVVPFTVKSRMSLKVRNFNSQKLKVNDASGNPVEIAAVVVFKVTDTARAAFDVDDYETFVEIQSETAIRHIAAQYPYDTYEDNSVISLRGNADEISGRLLSELQDRLSVAGVEVLETRLSHLAYAAEIAGAMLQRQQAEAIVAARQKIVDGAVGMVESALQQLKHHGIVLDDERRAAMINNLMVAIVSERGTTPVINTGTLYN
ncbi:MULTISPECIES: SPFH domain-containing protein [unclassified Paenibacillus]|uniref:SPFH domain-containing protein n=1 Tax=unclassified Paenibacillus TaxID=185978 RepID=UPI0009556C5D|nr:MULTISPECIES: SPFH domain-containing protein [unclassified Paenibacillus]ASS68784.1 SPFH domain-containing protein [Paenibacillus sp. RUD330]SIR57594.1 Regulator of protease activity HflC, stomatin/prohibitin superfamily [Paenibacillus sp. RU4X]SIR66262.1 Regulator of protease activity HflC, stomatin/prohibitin superfamily [Paenibacillus sp. RU4T]